MQNTNRAETSQRKFALRTVARSAASHEQIKQISAFSQKLLYKILLLTDVSVKLGKFVKTEYLGRGFYPPPPSPSHPLSLPTAPGLENAYGNPELADVEGPSEKGIMSININ